MPTLSTTEAPNVESSTSAIRWGPIFAGAFAAVAATVILMLLGSGLGLTLISPWSGESASLTAIAASTAAWLIIVQWLSSALGGYLSGRLRTKWADVHTDEVFFRDTAHGFMAWAVATLLVLGMVGFHSTLFLGAGTHLASSVAGGSASGATQSARGGTSSDITDYFVDAMLRPTDPTRLTTPGAEADQAATAQISRILGMSAIEGKVSKDDRDYVASLVAARSGLSTQEAQGRVESVLARAQDMKAKLQAAADEARKTSATIAILGALSLIIGAFIASVAGAIGGRQRDDSEQLFIHSLREA